MSICREWTLVKHLAPFAYAKPLYCRSWSCEECAPRRKRQLRALAAAGEPTRFITLTVNPREGTDPSDRLRRLANAWRIVIKRLRRLHEGTKIDYLCIIEETEAGEPHAHILYRGPYIPQAWLSAAMDELISAPIVDIRRIHSARQAVMYVTKYVTKAPALFNGCKRYWCSQGYDLGKNTEPEPSTPPGAPWIVDQRGMITVLHEWLFQGLQARVHKADIVIGIPIDWDVQRRE